MTPFKNIPITIDYENKILSIETEKSLNKLIVEKDFDMPIQITNDREIKFGIATTIELDNKLTLDVGLDSGAGFEVFRFNMRYMEKMGIDKTKVKNEFRLRTNHSQTA